MPQNNSQNVDVLAKTIYGEARGEGQRGMHAVANVIMNRVAVSEALGGFWWGVGVIGVCKAKWQFSCWNKSDPNLKQLNGEAIYKKLAFTVAENIAEEALEGNLEDITDGATSYHTSAVNPWWAEKMTFIKEIGNHLFYTEK